MSALERLKRAAKPGASPYNVLRDDPAKLIAAITASTALLNACVSLDSEQAILPMQMQALRAALTALEKD